jgi:hypothetical protein
VKEHMWINGMLVEAHAKKQPWKEESPIFFKKIVKNNRLPLFIFILKSI